jgi:phage gp16-like protein
VDFMSDLRKNDLAKIHMAKKDLALTDDTYRAMLMRLTGKESAAALTLPERAKVLKEFERFGWKPKAAKPVAAKRTQYSRPTSRKLAAQWGELYSQGKVVNKTQPALLNWVMRQTGCEDLKTLDWLSNEEANACINALKKWIERPVEGGDGAA